LGQLDSDDPAHPVIAAMTSNTLGSDDPAHPVIAAMTVNTLVRRFFPAKFDLPGLYQNQVKWHKAKQFQLVPKLNVHWIIVNYKAEIKLDVK
jgi:hypothetical protein